MTDSPQPELVQKYVEELSKLPILSGLERSDLEWLANRVDEKIWQQGDITARPGDPVDYMLVLLEGELQIERVEEPGVPFIQMDAGQITGALPFSRLQIYNGIGRAVRRTRALRLHKSNFPALVQGAPLLGQRLVNIMSDRIREVARVETQNEKLMALGKLSAGLAHELNNPAAAARRAAQSLSEALENVRGASLKLLEHPQTMEQRTAIFQFEREAGASVAKRDVAEDPLVLSDREDSITRWLETKKVPEPWKLASTLAEAGVETPQLDSLAAIVGDSVVGDALGRIAAIISIFGLIYEIENSTKRISELVSAVKRYSYMDQAPMQQVDLHQDLENTLKIFGHWLKSGITVVRDYDPNLPRVCAYGSELNQVWTNLIDNAIDAMGGKGELKIQTRRELDGVCIEIADSGPGISEDLQSRIFEPFFTTKGVGKGTGMGLDTVSRIVRVHHGQVSVRSKPGETVFRVRLPIAQPKPSIAPRVDPAQAD